MKQKTCYIALGGNAGDRRSYIEQALDELDKHPQIAVKRKSSIIETLPLGTAAMHKFLNAAAEIVTTLDAQALYKELAAIENKLGRVRTEKWGPRTIDIDLLLYGDEVIDTNDLKVPHPQMHLRSFVLDCLYELNPDIIHSQIKVSVSELRKRLNGGDFALDAAKPQLISIAGIIGVGKTTLAENLSSLLNADILREPYSDNPFLPQVYAGNADLALDSQLFFLVNRADQLSFELQPARTYICDYVFDKELIYARELLDSRQMILYDKIFKNFADCVTIPALTIYLYDSPDNCLDRIKKRNRPYEQKITLDFLQRLADDYDDLFAGWKKSPLFRIDASAADMRQSEQLEKRCHQIKFYVAGGQK
ncbi:MAG: 2-amino-4-hydroxy-6-hydroxymethyldihydropteridine diphosphokinase [Phycisphaerae bacterium]|nr:2-amino-4-hydroxy-6-hydroxymethyldihydropteridine diphosphokinase [Phycisphaerae bacterium]